MRNMRSSETGTGRRRLSTRPGHSRYFPGAVGLGPVVEQVSVNRPSVSTGYKLGETADPGAGSSVLGTALAGNVFALDQVPSMNWSATLEADSVVSAPSPQVNACCFTPDGTMAIVAGSALNPTYRQLKVRAINTTTGATVWTYTFSEGSNDWYVTAVCATNDFVFVCTRNEFHMLWLRDPYPGANYAGKLGRRQICNGWSQVVTACGVHSQQETTTGPLGTTTTTVWYLTVAFYGTSEPGTIHGGTLLSGEVLGTTIEAGITASHFRTGVMRMRISPFPVVPSPYLHPPAIDSIYALQVPFGRQLESTDPRYEGRHDYFRVSEQSLASPHGCYITAMAVLSDGAVVCTRTNQGWGPTTAWRPDGTDNGRPMISVFKIDRLGSMVWEQDPGSVVGDGTGNGAYAGHPHYNDINNPTFKAVARSALDAVAIAGRQNDATKSVAVLTSTGLIEWDANLMDATRSVRALEFDPTDGNLIAAGDRNTSWDDSGGDEANLWKLQAADGSVAWHYDLNAAVSALAVAASSDGTIVFGTDIV